MKLKGKSQSEAHKKAISEGNMGITRGKGRISPNKNNKYSKEVCEKISNSRKGIVFSLSQKELMSKNQWKIRSINQYDLDGNFIRSWDSITSAKKVVKGYIDGVLSGRQKQSGGFIWKYKEEFVS